MAEVKEAKKETKELTLEEKILKGLPLTPKESSEANQFIWQKKVKLGMKLSVLEQVKADAYRTQTRRERQAKEDAMLAEERKLEDQRQLTAADLDIEE